MAILVGIINMEEMIGIDNQIWSDTAGGGSIGLGFAIPSNDAKFILNNVLQYGRPRLGWIGVRVQTVTSRMAEVLKFKEPSGAIIANVADNSPAAEAGLKIGEIVIGIEGKKSLTTGPLIRLLRGLPARLFRCASGAVVRSGR